jgi:hypothetical protein
MKVALAYAAVAAAALGAGAAGPQDKSFGSGLAALAQDKEALKAALKDEVVGNWIYDDLQAGYSAAKKSGKPMLVVFR